MPSRCFMEVLLLIVEIIYILLILFAELAKRFAFHIYALATAIFYFKDLTCFYYISKMNLKNVAMVIDQSPIFQLINQSINQSVIKTKSINLSIYLSIDWSIDRLIGLSIYLSIYLSIDRSIDRLINQSVNEMINKSNNFREVFCCY